VNTTEEDCKLDCGGVHKKEKLKNTSSPYDPKIQTVPCKVQADRAARDEMNFIFSVWWRSLI
jgi:hypothetical protein